MKIKLVKVMVKKFNELFNNYEEVDSPGYLGGNEYSEICSDINKLISYLKGNWEPFTDVEVSKIREFLTDIEKQTLPFSKHLNQSAKYTINKYSYLTTYTGESNQAYYNIYKCVDEWYWVHLHYVSRRRHQLEWRSILYKCDQFDGLIELLSDLI